MMQDQVTDEMLMAFVDGELEAAETSRIEALLEVDAALALRAERLLETRNLVREAFATDREETVPAQLVAAALGTKQDFGQAPRARLGQWAMAASVAFVAGLAGFVANGLVADHRSPPSLIATATSADLLARLATTPLGLEVRLEIADNSLSAEVVGSFPVEQGYCRLFTLGGQEGQVRALACGSDAEWSVPVAVLESSSGFQPASGAEAIDVYLDSAGAGAALDGAAEAEAINRNWSPQE